MGLRVDSLQCFCSSPCLSQGSGPSRIHWRSNWKDPELGGWEQHFVTQAEQGQRSHLSSSLLIRNSGHVVAWPRTPSPGSYIWMCGSQPVKLFGKKIGGAWPWWQRCQWRWALRSQKSTRFPDSCRSVSYRGPFLICWKTWLRSTQNSDEACSVLQWSLSLWPEHGTRSPSVCSWLRSGLSSLLNFLWIPEIASTFSSLHAVGDLQGMGACHDSHAHTAPLSWQKYLGLVLALGSLVICSWGRSGRLVTVPTETWSQNPQTMYKFVQHNLGHSPINYCQIQFHTFSFFV